MEELKGFINEPEFQEDAQTEDTTDEKQAEEINQHEKFRKDAISQMERIYASIQKLEKLSQRRNAGYTEEEVERMFEYLEDRLADCKKAYLQKLNPEKFDFEF